MPLSIFLFRLQVRYGTHLASTHPNDVEGDLTEILLGEDEVLTDIAAGVGAIIDNIQFTTNVMSYPRLGHLGLNHNYFISATEILYFTGSEAFYAVMRVSGIAAMASTC